MLCSQSNVGKPLVRADYWSVINPDKARGCTYNGMIK